MQQEVITNDEMGDMLMKTRGVGGVKTGRDEG